MEEERERCRALLAKYIHHIGGAKHSRDLQALFSAVKRGLTPEQFTLPAPAGNPPT